LAIINIQLEKTQISARTRGSNRRKGGGHDRHGFGNLIFSY